MQRRARSGRGAHPGAGTWRARGPSQHECDIERLGPRGPKRQRRATTDASTSAARPSSGIPGAARPIKRHTSQTIERRDRHDQQARPGRPGPSAMPGRGAMSHSQLCATNGSPAVSQLNGSVAGMRARRDDRVADREVPPGVRVDLRSPGGHPRLRRARRPRASRPKARRRATVPTEPSLIARW